MSFGTHRLSIAGRLAIFVVVAVIAACTCAWAGLEQAAHLSSQSRRALVAKDVVADILPPPLYLIELRLALSAASEGLLEPDEAVAEVERLIGEYEARVRHWRENPPFGLERDLLGGQHEAGMAFIAQARTLLPAMRAGDRSVVQAKLAGVHEQFRQHRAGVLRTVQSGTRLADESMASFSEGARSAQHTQLIVLSTSLLALGWLAYVSCRSIQRPLAKAVAASQRIGAGELVECEPHAGRDEVSRVLTSLSAASRRLADVARGVRAHSADVTSCSRRIAEGSCRLGQRTLERSDQVSRAAKSLDRVSEAARSTHARLHDARRIAEASSLAARHGGEVVQQVVATMQESASSANRVERVVDLIDDMASQTNLLALNAAVEAARAGSGGRGFAVVAAEVRGLAQRCAAAAGEIRQLAVYSASIVRDGVEQSERTRLILNDMAERVGELLEIMRDIGRASTRQDDAVVEAHRALGEFVESTRADELLVSESRAAASELERQAGQLARPVAFFRVQGGAGRGWTEIVHRAEPRAGG